MSKQTLLEAAAESTHTAAEKSAAALETTIERATALLEQAADRLAPLLADAKIAAKDAKIKAAGFAADTVEQIQPTLNTALEKVPPAVEKAQHTVTDQYIPTILDALKSAAAKGEEAIGALADDIAQSAPAKAVADVVPVKKKTSKTKTFFIVAGIGAALAAAAVALRSFLSPKDAGWASYQPAPAYTYPGADTDAATTEKTADEASDESDTEQARDRMDSEGGSLEEVTPDENVPLEGYGEGSYVGTEPPEGFAIKGNERSMKYHTPESGGYERTIADVWFNSEDAAQAAGFTRAQR